MSKETFEKFLRSRFNINHEEKCSAIGNFCCDLMFEVWLNELGTKGLIRYADRYAEKRLREIGAIK